MNPLGAVSKYGWPALGMLAAAALAGDAARLPEGNGKKLMQAACSACHGLEPITSKRLSRQRWQVLVLGMADSRASLSKADEAELVEYLTKNFGEPDRGKELVEEICSLCHEWERVKEQHLSRDQWAGVIKGMIFEGAPVTEEEFDQIVNYLARHYGKTKE